MRSNGGERRRATGGMTQLQTNLTLALHTLPEIAGNLRGLLHYVQRLEAAVTFYADAETWDTEGVARHGATLEQDRGETARAALLRHVNTLLPFGILIPLSFLVRL